MERTNEIVKKFTYQEDGWGGMSSDPVAWCNFRCPVCDVYNSLSFLFDFEPDKDHYFGSCSKCGATIRIEIDLKLNNLIYEEWGSNLRKIIGPQQTKLFS